MADKHYRLICFVGDICADVLRKYFVKLAKNDAGSSYTTVGSYLDQKHDDVEELQQRNILRQYQYNLLYPDQGTTNIKKWDVTLLVALILGLFKESSQSEIPAMKEIRGIRNGLSHYGRSKKMSDFVFDDYWKRLTDAVKDIAKSVLDPSGIMSLQEKINKAMCSSLPGLSDILRDWYEECMMRYEEKIDHLEKELSEVKSQTKETNDTLRQVTVQIPRPSGDKDKRIKVADNILARLQANFESSMKELSIDFNAPNEVREIRTKLRDCHHVVVTGSNNSRYLDTALTAITGMGYNYKRSVEMNTSCDWRHIDPKDVDLVVCRNPFGSYSYDESKARAMADIFDSMLYSTRRSDGDKTLDIIIVTDFKILEECMGHLEHGILEEVVKVFTNTSLTEPADLTTGVQVQNMSSSLMPLSRNLDVMTSNFLSEYITPSRQVDEDVLRKAKEKLKACKAIVLTGEKKCGKTSVAVALASSYEPSQCLLLTEPSDVHKIDFQKICLVIIDEFAGKYRFEENDVYKWYKMFDHLHRAVKAGQMNVIITCEKSKLDKCVNEIVQHAILANMVEVPTQKIVVKQEKAKESSTEREQDPVTKNSEQTGLKRRKLYQTPVLAVKRLRSSTSHEWVVESYFQNNIRMEGENGTCRISGSCSLPSGEILLLDEDNRKLKKIDSSYNLISTCDLPLHSSKVCYAGADEVVVSATDKKLHFVDTSHDMKLIRSVDIEHVCSALACHGDTIYVRDLRGPVYKYNKNGIRQQHLYTNSDIRSGIMLTRYRGIAVSDDGSKLYIPDKGKLVTIDNNGKELFTLNHTGIKEDSAVCVDNQGHVLVSSHRESILQISDVGERIFTALKAYFPSDMTKTVLFDRKNTALLIAGSSDRNIVLTLKLN